CADCSRSSCCRRAPAHCPCCPSRSRWRSPGRSRTTTPATNQEARPPRDGALWSSFSSSSSCSPQDPKQARIEPEITEARLAAGLDQVDARGDARGAARLLLGGGTLLGAVDAAPQGPPAGLGVHL